MPQHVPRHGARNANQHTRDVDRGDDNHDDVLRGPALDLGHEEEKLAVARESLAAEGGEALDARRRVDLRRRRGADLLLDSAPSAVEHYRARLDAAAAEPSDDVVHGIHDSEEEGQEELEVEGVDVCPVEDAERRHEVYVEVLGKRGRNRGREEERKRERE
eukprot:2216358-Rhodomonas_salina.2